MVNSLKLIFISLMLLFTFISGCKNDNTVAVSDSNLSVGYFTPASGGDNILIIDEAKFIVRKMVLEEEGDHEGDCDIKIGPFVVYMDLNHRVVSAAVVKVPAGTYHEIKFQIHKLGKNESVGDPEFAEGDDRFSVIVKGVFNNTPFNYKSRISFSKEIEFENFPIAVSETSFINITIRLDIMSWLMKDGNILDPADPDNRSEIDNNIKRSFKRAFKDLNMDGEPD